MKRLLLILLLLPLFTDAQIITTIAGIDTPGRTGDGGLAIDAKLWLPFGVTVDGIGNVYISDYGSCRIRQINTSGVINTIAGSGTCYFLGDGGSATAADLNDPVNVAIDNHGSIYIADMGNNAIRKVSITGIISTIAGNGIGGTGSYGGDGGLAVLAELNQPSCVAVDTNGNIFIADFYNSRIRKINSSGIISTIAGTGTHGYSGDGGLATAAQLWGCQGIFVTVNGTVYIADAFNNRIRTISPSGIISTVAGNGVPGYGGDGGPATSAELSGPCQIALDNVGNMYIADYGNYCIRKVSTTGIISTFAGCDTAGYSGDGNTATHAKINSPQDVAVDGAGNVFIADYVNNCIRKVSPGPSGVSNLANPATETIKLYPNPATTSITISSTDKITSIAITNLIGQTVYSNNYHNEQVQVDISALPAGMYLVRINGTEVRKFVKE